jgi:hypothetical protein
VRRRDVGLLAAGGLELAVLASVHASNCSGVTCVVFETLVTFSTWLK